MQKLKNTALDIQFKFGWKNIFFCLNIKKYFETKNVGN